MSTDTGLRHRRRVIGCLVVLAAALLVPSTSGAAGELLHLTVVNSLGTPLVGVYVKKAGTSITVTNGGGEASLELGSSVSAGETLEFALYPTKEAPPPGPCDTPAYSVSYVVPEPPPATATVTMPALPSSLDPAFEPGLSNPELKFLGLMNDLRRSMGVAPLQASTTLDAVADRYLSRLKTVSNEEEPHCQAGSPQMRAIDAGFPTSNTGENLAYNGMCSAEGVYGSFYSEKGKPEDGHYLNMTDSEYTTVGVATDGSSWVIDYAVLPLNNPFVGRAGLTGQLGDASLPDANCEIESPTHKPAPTKPASRMSPRLRIINAAVAGSVLHLMVHLRVGVEGRVEVAARRIGPSHGHRSLILPGRGIVRRGHIPLGVGRWQIVVHFLPAPATEWTSAVTRRRIVVPGR